MLLTRSPPSGASVCYEVFGIDEWVIQLVQAMYCQKRSTVRVENCFSDSFSVNVVVHHGFFVSPLLFIMVLEVLLKEFRTRCPWKWLHTDNFVITAESVEELCHKLTA